MSTILLLSARSRCTESCKQFELVPQLAQAFSSSPFVGTVAEIAAFFYKKIPFYQVNNDSRVVPTFIPAPPGGPGDPASPRSPLKEMISVQIIK